MHAAFEVAPHVGGEALPACDFISVPKPFLKSFRVVDFEGRSGAIDSALEGREERGYPEYR